MRNRIRLDAIILGGGRGTRLWPLTHLRAKPAVQIAGKYRLIDIPMSNCINSGIKHIHILTQFNTTSLHRHISQTYKFDIFSRGNIELLAAQQTLENSTWFQGTADAVRSYWQRFKDLPATHFIILAGDHLYRMDYQDFLSFHLDSDADLTISAKPIPLDRIREFGIMKCDQSNRVIDFMEKPEPGDVSNLKQDGWIVDTKALVSMGIYIFKKDILGEALKMEGDDFGREIVPACIRQFRASAYQFDGYWVDIGTVGSFFDANMALTRETAEFSFYNIENPIYTYPRFLPSSRIAEGDIRRSIVGEGCVVGKSKVRDSILGMRSVVGNDVLMEEVYQMGADFYDSDLELAIYPKTGIDDGSRLRKVILDKNVSVGKNAVLENPKGVQHKDGDYYFIREGIIIVPKGTKIPDNTVIRADSEP